MRPPAIASGDGLVGEMPGGLGVGPKRQLAAFEGDDVLRLEAQIAVGVELGANAGMDEQPLQTRADVGEAQQGRSFDDAYRGSLREGLCGLMSGTPSDATESWARDETHGNQESESAHKNREVEQGELVSGGDYLSS